MFYYYKMKFKLFCSKHILLSTSACIQPRNWSWSVWSYFFGLQENLYSFTQCRILYHGCSLMLIPYSSTSGTFRRSNRLSYDWWAFLLDYFGPLNFVKKSIRLALIRSHSVCRCIHVLCARGYGGLPIIIPNPIWSFSLWFPRKWTLEIWFEWAKHFKCTSIVKEMF